MDEQKKYDVIKRLVDENGNKDRAAMTLGITRRQVNRLIKAYVQKGKTAFSHGNKGRRPATVIPQETRQAVLDLYRTKYCGANFTHFVELLKRIEGISLSVSSVSAILEDAFLLSPRVTKAKKKRIVRNLRKKQESAVSKKEAAMIQASLVAIEDAHSRRPRCAYFGELEQMDATPYDWVPGQTWHLHLAIDDATGSITGAWFDTQETLNGYYHVLRQMLEEHGIPYKLFTDRRTIFTYKKKNSPSIDEDTFTQFSYACRQLGILLESSSVPQAKGRVERLNQTLQSRLPVELRLAGATTIETANEFLHSYVKEFNAKFALHPDSIRSVFEVQPQEEKINLVLAVLSERTVDCGHCIQYEKKYYRMLNAIGMQEHYRKGTKVMVIKAFDGGLYCSINDKDIYVLDEIPEREKKSKELDADYMEPRPKKQYIPPMSHPWRRREFWGFVKQQAHHLNDEIPA